MKKFLFVLVCVLMCASASWGAEGFGINATSEKLFQIVEQVIRETGVVDLRGRKLVFNQPQVVEYDGKTYREASNIVFISAEVNPKNDYVKSISLRLDFPESVSEQDMENLKFHYSFYVALFANGLSTNPEQPQTIQTEYLKLLDKLAKNTDNSEKVQTDNMEVRFRFRHDKKEFFLDTDIVSR